MCDINKCDNESKFWVMTRREITTKTTEFSKSFPSHLSSMVCGKHISSAITDLITVSDKAREYVDSKDGVIVRLMPERGNSDV